MSAGGAKFLRLSLKKIPTQGGIVNEHTLKFVEVRDEPVVGLARQCSLKGSALIHQRDHSDRDSHYCRKPSNNGGNYGLRTVRCREVLRCANHEQCHEHWRTSNSTPSPRPTTLSGCGKLSIRTGADLRWDLSD